MVKILASSVGTTSTEEDDKFGVPEEYCVVYSFAQIGIPDDMGLHTKTWRKIKTYIEKQNPHYKKE